MCGRKASDVRTVPRRLVSSIHFQSPGLMRSSGPWRNTPAMLIRMSTPPIALIVSAARERTEESLRTSVGRARAASALPRWRISSTVRSNRSASKSAITTRAPCWASARATVRPMPLAPPTTTATLPLSAPRGFAWSWITARQILLIGSRASTPQPSDSPDYPGFSKAMNALSPDDPRVSDLAQERDWRRQHEVELHGDEDCDAQVRIDEAQEHRNEVERLRTEDPPPEEPRDCLSMLFWEHAAPQAVLDAGEQHRSHKEDVHPVEHQGGP